MNLINGVVQKILSGKEGGDPHSFVILGEDYLTYYAHVGDLKKNEMKLYKNLDTPTEFLKVGDSVQFHCFMPTIYLLAIHVEKKDIV